jgi:hypothetical protein
MPLLITIIALIALPDVSFAWGFETHLNIGMQVLNTSRIDVITNNPQFFLCGNIFPDLFNLFKDFSSFKKNLPTHSWQTVSKLNSDVRSDAEQAFIYGYSAHLSADIIAHNNMVPQHIAYVDSGRMRSHLIFEMAEESMHYNRYSKMLRLLLKFSPKYGEVFLRNMGIEREWFESESKAIRLGVISQHSLKLHAITRIVKKTVQPGFAERVAYFREAALKQAMDSVENGFSTLEHLDPSGKESMESARELRKEMLKNNSKRQLRKEYNSHIDQEHFSLKSEGA